MKKNKLRTNKFVQCPNCHRFLFLAKDDEQLWYLMGPYEKVAFRIIKISNMLTLMFGKVKIDDYECDECKQSKLN